MAEVAGGKEGTRSTLPCAIRRGFGAATWKILLRSITQGIVRPFLLDAAAVCTLEHFHAVKDLTEVESMIPLTECYIENNPWYNFFLNQMRRRELGALGRVSTRQLTTCVELLHVVELDGQSI